MPKAKKKIRVTRGFLLELANRIYDPKTRRFLRLCTGKLQNGPDPTDPKRPMHCGLGELYFAMTGKQPNRSRVTETDVIELAAQSATFEGTAEVARRKAITDMARLRIPSSVKQELLHRIRVASSDEFSPETEFRRILRGIQPANDHTGQPTRFGMCKSAAYRRRAAAVARVLREAAKLLPE